MAMLSSGQSTNSEDSQVESAKIFQTRRSLFMSSSSSESSEQVSVDEEETNGEEEEEEINGEESEVDMGDEKNGEEEELNSRGDEKISISCLLDLIGKVLEKGRDDLTEFFKELSKQNSITMSKLIDEMLAESQRFSSNGEYGDCLIFKKLMAITSFIVGLSCNKGGSWKGFEFGLDALLLWFASC
ncbi:hypothetical protein SUGI_1152080 [Cryptomeria japonica]|nr:hypothetical protein SUGI_1152080 [Cryptomeria japonica]